MVSITRLDTSAPRLSFTEKLWSLNWGLLLLLTLIASFGFAMLYSAANGDLQPWAARQMMRYGVAVALMIGVALVDIRFWLRSAYIVFGIAFVLLVAERCAARLAWVPSAGSISASSSCNPRS